MELRQSAAAVIEEVCSAVVGKEDVIEKVMMAVIAGGHVLIEDIPGVGKTTMARAFSKAMGLKANRVQFTPDIMPSDLTGYSVYQKELERFVYQPGAVICNLLLADEINRTSPKTQSALLEVMEERQVTVDGETRPVGRPFLVMATENPEGAAGTQLLPDSQLDRFMICICMGYPSVKEEMEILKRMQGGRAEEQVEAILTAQMLLDIQKEAEGIFIHDLVYEYLARLAKTTREQELLAVGLSPRGTVALAAMSKACAFLRGRNYVVPEDAAFVFPCVAGHRVKLSAKAKVSHVKPEEVLLHILEEVKRPSLKKR